MKPVRLSDLSMEERVTVSGRAVDLEKALMEVKRRKVKRRKSKPLPVICLGRGWWKWKWKRWIWMKGL
ncbi:MAG: hypothetical protein QW734_05490 [Candidatus Bathyarchaeia archaeon]